MLCDATVPFADPPDAPPDIVALLAGAPTRQPLVELDKGALEALGKATGDPFLLVHPLFGTAVKPPLPGLLVDDVVQVNLLPLPGLDPLGQLRVEAAETLTADHEITLSSIAVFI